MAGTRDENKGRSIFQVFATLHQRAAGGFNHAPFILAFWGGVVLAGGLGMWVEIYKLIVHPADGSLASLRTAVSTFFPALIGATSLQMAFEDEVKSNRGVAFIASFILFGVFIVMMDSSVPNWLAFIIGILASCASLWIWCAAYGNSPSLQDLPIDASVGGPNLEATLAGSNDFGDLKH